MVIFTLKDIWIKYGLMIKRMKINDIARYAERFYGAMRQMD